MYPSNENDNSGPLINPLQYDNSNEYFNSNRNKEPKNLQPPTPSFNLNPRENMQNEFENMTNFEINPNTNNFSKPNFYQVCSSKLSNPTTISNKESENKNNQKNKYYNVNHTENIYQKNNNITPETNMYQNKNNNNKKVLGPISGYLNSTINSKLIEAEAKLTKYSDFRTICYVMFVWSLLCLFWSLWYLTNYRSIKINNVNDLDIDIYEDEVLWYRILLFLVDLLHCYAYFMGIRAFNHQSSGEMNFCHKCFIILIVANCIFFFLFIFFVSVSFITFCIQVIFLIFNVILSFQSIELQKIYHKIEQISS